MNSPPQATCASPITCKHRACLQARLDATERRLATVNAHLGELQAAMRSAITRLRPPPPDLTP